MPSGGVKYFQVDEFHWKKEQKIVHLNKGVRKIWILSNEVDKVDSNKNFSVGEFHNLISSMIFTTFSAGK